MIIINLSDMECRIANMIGQCRRQISLSYNRITTRRDFTTDGLRNDIESAAAEMAVAKHLNIYPEWSPTPGEVPKFDLVWNGQRLDVKSTTLPSGNLLIPYLDETIIYFLVFGEMPKKSIVGFLSGELVRERGRWRADMPHEPCWFVPVERLEQLNKGSVS